MSKDSLDRNQQQSAFVNRSETEQKKINPNAQLEWLNNSKVDYGFGVFGNRSAAWQQNQAIQTVTQEKAGLIQRKEDEVEENDPNQKEGEPIKSNNGGKIIGNPYAEEDNSNQSIDGKVKSNNGSKLAENPYWNEDLFTGFNPENFTWVASGSLSAEKIATKLRNEYGIGYEDRGVPPVKFDSHKEFANFLLEYNKQTSISPFEMLATNTVLQIPHDSTHNVLLSDNLYAPKNGSIGDATKEEDDAKAFSPNLKEIENITNKLKSDLDNLTGINQIYLAVSSAGSTLWDYCVAKSQKKKSADHLLYFGRNLMRTYIKETSNVLIKDNSEQITQLIFQLEQHSRGLSIAIPNSPEVFQVLMAGFDPFLSENNFSGQLAMQYHNKEMSINGRQVKFYSQVFPVRYKDFENGIVENFYKDKIDFIDMVINTGQGGGKFEVEGSANNFALGFSDNNKERRRSSEVINGGTPTYNSNLISEQEFNNSKLINKNKIVYDKSNGPAGSYFCNEIGYRVHATKNSKGVKIPSGFIHVPEENRNSKRNKLKPKFDKIISTILKQRVPKK